MPKKSKVSEQAQDADFLVENFGVPTPAAADLVAREGVDPKDVELATRRLNDARDPLAGVPIPEEPTDELTRDNDEVRLKPIVRKNDRRGAG